MTPVDHRYQLVLESVKSKTAPTDDLLARALYQHLVDADMAKAPFEVLRAHDIYSHEFKREMMEACLLVGVTADEIEELLKVPEAVTRAYAHLYFDTSVFADDLDLVDYAYEYKGSKFGAELKRYAVDLGKECLKIRVSRGNYVAPPAIVQDGIRTTAYIMAQLVKVNQADSSMANAALRWAQVGLKAAENVTERIDVDGQDNFRMALETKEESVDAQTSGIAPEEILH